MDGKERQKTSDGNAKIIPSSELELRRAERLQINGRHRSYDEIGDDEIANDVFLEEDERMTAEDIDRLERRSRGESG